MISIVFFMEIRIQTILRSSWLRRSLNCNCAIRFAIPHGIYVETEFEKGARGQSLAEQRPVSKRKIADTREVGNFKMRLRGETVSLFLTAVTSKLSSKKELEGNARRNARRLWGGN